MSGISYFESRTGKVDCTSEELFDFVTDIRHFEQFAPQGTIRNWHAEKESCTFSVSTVGTVNLRIKEKTANKVVYNGDALKVNDFSLALNISEGDGSSSEVKIELTADLNPILKMMASKPIARFLEILIVEMEKFSGWKDIRG